MATLVTDGHAGHPPRPVPAFLGVRQNMTEQPYSPLPRVADSTKVTFPAGATNGTSRVLASGSWGLIVEETPFHPLNPRWPDQPADTGTIEIAGWLASVVDCLVGAVEFESGRLLIGADIPVPHGAPGWHWVVVHVLNPDPDRDLHVEIAVETGVDAILRVNPRRRLGLSLAHTTRHLCGLALNATLAPLAPAGMPVDSLGQANFDALTLSSSAITTTGFRNTYRIWTGPLSEDTAALAPLVHQVGLAVNERVRDWLAEPVTVRVVPAGPGLADPRVWECDLPDGTARVACGGTHPMDLSLIADIRVTATLSADQTELILVGEVIGRSTTFRPRTRTTHAARLIHTGLRAIRH